VITFFETTGWKGIIQGRNAPSLPSLFRSQADAVFPVYFIFYWLAKLRGAHIVPVQSTFPGTVTGLCLQLDKEKFLFLVNLSEDPQTFPVRNFKKGEIISRLNEKTAASFLKDPLSFLEKNLANPLEETVQMMPYEVMILKS
jgi:hypothetical protein